MCGVLLRSPRSGGSKVPIIFRLHANTVNGIEGLTAQLETLETKFSNDPSRADPGRLQRKISDELSDIQTGIKIVFGALSVW